MKNLSHSRLLRDRAELVRALDDLRAGSGTAFGDKRDTKDIEEAIKRRIDQIDAILGEPDA